MKRLIYCTALVLICISCVKMKDEKYGDHDYTFAKKSLTQQEGSAYVINLIAGRIAYIRDSVDIDSMTYHQIYQYGLELEKQRKIRENIENKRRKDSLAKIEAEKLAYKNRTWKINTYTDEFGEDTGKKFLKMTTTGTFSNSAVSNEFLGVKMYIDKINIGLFLHEYDWSRQAEKFSSCNMMLKNEKGKILRLSLVSEWNHSGGMKVSTWRYKGSSNVSKLKYFIKTSKGIIKVRVKDKYSSTYKFEFKVDNYVEEYKLL